MTLSKKSKMATLINSRIKVTIQDSRTFVGQMLAFDKYMNLVLADCEEFRKIKPKGKVPANQGDREEKRALGLIILRGEIIVNLSVVAPPPAQNAKPKPTVNIHTPGIGKPAGRGMPATSLAGPVRGLGGPAPQIMQPMGRAGMPPAPFGRGMVPPPAGAPNMIRPPNMYRPPNMPPPQMGMPQGYRPPQMRPMVPQPYNAGRGGFQMPPPNQQYRPRPPTK